MSFASWFKNILSTPGSIPADIPRLSSANQNDLSSSLQSLPSGERGWIALQDAAHLFSSKQPEYAFGEMDEEGSRQLAQFAAKCRCDIQFMPMEGRVYFAKR